MQPKTPETTELETAFDRLAAEWRRGTALDSVGKRTIEHPAYQQIIAIGESALPLIFKEMEANGGHWFYALRQITGENPVTKEMWGKVREMQETWLEWGREQGYTW